MMVTGDGLDLNDHVQVFNAVFNQVYKKQDMDPLYVFHL